jgi:hypothetical protein
MRGTADRDELDTLLVNAVMAEARSPDWQNPEGQNEDWENEGRRVDVRTILTALWQAVRSHSNVIPLILTRRTSHETMLEIVEAAAGEGSVPMIRPGALCSACFVALVWLFLAVHGRAEPAVNACRPGATDDTLKPLPAGLVAWAKQVFGLDMPDDMVRKNTVYRCLNGRTLLCAAGANLVCGKANRSRDLPGVADWCRDNRNSDDVPMFVTGHDTIYRWRCSNGKPAVSATVEDVDARGFLARNWKDAGG